MLGKEVYDFSAAGSVSSKMNSEGGHYQDCLKLTISCVRKPEVRPTFRSVFSVDFLKAFFHGDVERTLWHGTQMYQPFPVKEAWVEDLGTFSDRRLRYVIEQFLDERIIAEFEHRSVEFKIVGKVRNYGANHSMDIEWPVECMIKFDRAVISEWTSYLAVLQGRPPPDGAKIQ